MKIDIISVVYLIVRLSPLLVVSHFTLHSILNQDSKGVIYLIGLILTSFFSFLFGRVKTGTSSTGNDEKDLVCKTMGIDDFSNLSLSQIVLGYTFGYLLYIIINFDKVSYVNTNISTLVLFPILILANGIWHVSNGCLGYATLLSSVLLGGFGGVCWAAAIKGLGYKELAIFNGISNKAVCSKSATTRFVCKKGKNAYK